MPPPTPIPYSPSIPSMDPNLALLAFLIFVAKLYNLLIEAFAQRTSLYPWIIPKSHLFPIFHRF